MSTSTPEPAAAPNGTDRSTRAWDDVARPGPFLPSALIALVGIVACGGLCALTWLRPDLCADLTAARFESPGPRAVQQLVAGVYNRFTGSAAGGVAVLVLVLGLVGRRDPG